MPNLTGNEIVPVNMEVTDWKMVSMCITGLLHQMEDSKHFEEMDLGFNLEDERASVGEKVTKIRETLNKAINEKTQIVELSANDWLITITVIVWAMLDQASSPVFNTLAERTQRLGQRIMEQLELANEAAGGVAFDDVPPESE